MLHKERVEHEPDLILKELVSILALAGSYSEILNFGVYM